MHEQTKYPYDSEPLYEHPFYIPVEPGEIVINAGHIRHQFGQFLDELMQLPSTRFAKVQEKRMSMPKDFLVISGEDLALWLEEKLTSNEVNMEKLIRNLLVVMLFKSSLEEETEIKIDDLIQSGADIAHTIIFGIRQQVGQYYNPYDSLKNMMTVFQDRDHLEKELDDGNGATVLEELKRFKHIWGEKITITMLYLEQQLQGVHDFYELLAYVQDTNPKIREMFDIEALNEEWGFLKEMLDIADGIQRQGVVFNRVLNNLQNAINSVEMFLETNDKREKQNAINFYQFALVFAKTEFNRLQDLGQS